MTIKITISILYILFHITYSDQCSERINYLESKIDRILGILESTFRTGDSAYYPAKSNNNNIYGQGNVQSGGIYSPNTIKKRGTNLDLAPKKLDNRYESSSLKGKSKAANEKELSYLDKNIELEDKGFSDADAYVGTNVYNKDQSALEGFNKDEAYLTDVADGNIYEAEYSGTRINDSIAALRRNVVREEQTIEEGFFNDYQKENHEGDYKGNEFDLGYKSKEINGGFNELNAKNEAEQSRYFDKANKGEGYVIGADSNKEMYTREDEDKDLHGRNVRFNDGKGGKYGDYDNGYGNGNDYDNDHALYDKYTGKKPEINDKKGGYPNSGAGFGREREHYDKEKDIDERLYANEFDVNDKFGKSISNEDNIGVMSKLNQEKQYNNGKYVDVEAKGFNKNANYRGDYKNNKEQRNTGYTFKNIESVEEIGTPDRFASAIINDNRVDYYGKERKSSINADRKSGKYTDREINRKDKINNNANAYVGRDYINKREKEAEADKYYDRKNGKNINRDQYKKGYSNGNYNNKKPRLMNGDYGYYRPNNLDSR